MVSARTSCLLLALAATVGVVSVPLSGQNVTTSPRIPVYMTRAVSPSVAATYVGEPAAVGMEWLRLLVLWRGEPGWFNAWRRDAVPPRGSSGASPGHYSTTRMLGSFLINIAVDLHTKQATVQDQRFDLRRANVLLFDNVGAASPPVLVRTFVVQAHIPQTPLEMNAVAPILNLPDLREFLRCDQRGQDHVLPAERNLCEASRDR